MLADRWFQALEYIVVPGNILDHWGREPLCMCLAHLDKFYICQNMCNDQLRHHHTRISCHSPGSTAVLVCTVHHSLHRIVLALAVELGSRLDWVLVCYLD